MYMKTTPVEDVVWNLNDLYTGPGDPAMEADRQWCEDRALDFSQYRGKLATLSPEQLLEAVQSLERLNERAQKLLAFAYLFFATQTQEPAASALFQAQKEFYSRLRRDTLFFEIEWSKMDDSRAQALASDPALLPYRHYLVSLRRYTPHLLSEPEEDTGRKGTRGRLRLECPV